MHPPTQCAQGFNPGRWPWFRLGILAASLLLAAGCQSQTPSASPPSRATAVDADLHAEADLRARISSEIGDAPCSSDAQCRTLPIGAKACGGPEVWLPWSTQKGRANELQAMGDQLATMQRRRNERSGALSTCQYSPDPGAVCLAQRCLLRSRNTAN
jgi:hypothetical protein